MADKPFGRELLLSDTSVPDVFLVEYLNALSRDAIIVYLLLLMEKKSAYALEDIAKISCLPSTALDKALAELTGSGLLIFKDEKKYVFTDLKQKEVNDYIKLMVNRGIDTEGTELKAEEKLRNSLAGSISKSFYQGRMSQSFYRLIDKCLYEYKFESEVVYSLFESSCKDREHLKVGVMEAKAREWFNRGYLTTAKLNEYFEKRSTEEKMIKLFGRLNSRIVNDLDKERIRKWIYSMDVTPELAEYAFRCNEYRGKIQMKHVEDKLVEWHTAGISTIDAACVYEEERKKENTGKYARTKGTSNTMKSGDEVSKAWEKDRQEREKKPVEVVGEPSNSDADDDPEDDPILGLF